MRSDLIAQINLDNLAHNCRVLRAKCRPGTKICAVLKANAYGHGLSVVAPTLQAAGVDHAAVATLSEALELRSIRWSGPILMLGNVLAVADQRERQERLRALIKYDLTLTITDVETLRILARLNPQGPINVHVKVDTGMGRMGAMPDDVGRLLDLVVAAPHLRLVGLYSHFATADFEERELVDHQLRTFHEILARYGDRLPPRSIRHLANSAATLTLPEAHFDMVRPGLAMYGIPPAEWLGRDIDLRPILRLVSHLTAVKTLPPGHCVGYGRTFTTQRPTRLGIVPIGYFDGYLRSLSDAAIVGTAVGDAPVIGRVSMDQLALDLTDLPELHIGDEVVLIDDHPERPNSVPAIARLMGTIPYEVTCLLGERIQRVVMAADATEAVPAGASRGMAAPITASSSHPDQINGRISNRTLSADN